MGNIAIRAEGVSKRYRIGAKREKYRTLRGAIVDAVNAPIRRLKSTLRSQTPSDDQMIWALQDVSFEVQHGEAVGIIGRNGAGKSTLLKILSRITKPSKGTIDIYGRIGSLLEVGTGFHQELTGRENIYLNGAILGMTRKEIARKFDEIVAFSEVEKFIDTPAKHYSSGMYMRLAFAVAAHLEPEILIVDEVLAVGDAEFQKKCLGKMGEVASEGRTVLFVSHNLNAIQSLCSLGILLENGRVSMFSTVQPVVAKYLAQTREAVEKDNTDISNWPDRKGSGEAKIIYLDILDKSGNPTHEFSFRDHIRFRLTCQFPVEMEATFGVLIHSFTEEPLVDLRSTNTNMVSGKLKGRIVVESEVDVLDLYPGDYLISPWIMNQAATEDVDYVRYCARLKISTPVQKPTLALDPIWGKFFVEARWQILS